MCIRLISKHLYILYIQVCLNHDPQEPGREFSILNRNIHVYGKHFWICLLKNLNNIFLRPWPPESGWEHERSENLISEHIGRNLKQIFSRIAKVLRVRFCTNHVPPPLGGGGVRTRPQKGFSVLGEDISIVKILQNRPLKNHSPEENIYIMTRGSTNLRAQSGFITLH